MFKYNDTFFDLEFILIIINIIIKLLFKGKSNKAYQILLHAFIFEPLLQLGLFKYIKIIVRNYIESYHILFADYIIQKEILSNNYIENNTFLIININNEILCLNHEPDRLIISIISKVLGVNIIFYYLEPNNLFKHILIGNSNDSSNDSYIRIISSCSRYEIGYCNHYYVQSDYHPLSFLKAIHAQIICKI